MEEEEKIPSNFIQDIISADLESGKHKKIHTRFPPEPNGYLHIGHAKSICLNFGLALRNNGLCNLRFDDTNPSKEDVEYVDSIMEDVRWLGFDWQDRLFYASDYFQKFYEYALELINAGLAYVCDLNADDMHKYRGTLTVAGKNSPYRNRSIDENLELFEQMKNGEYQEGERTLRAKIDMASANMNMRDPVVYRILKTPHHRTGDKWCIYPMYDYAHCISDALEGITHSICTLEFEDHRPLYDWFLDHLSVPCHPRQIEFARLNVNYTVMSKRKLLELVTQKIVNGWDDPRMPTIAGMRRRGFTPEAIRNFADRIGVAKMNSTVDVDLLYYFVREDLNKKAQRVMAVLHPLKVIIDNYPEGQVEWLEAENNPEDASAGKRQIPFSRIIYIEQDDFREVAPPKYHRLYPGNEIRLKHAYYVKCESFVKDDSGKITEVHCSYDPKSRGGWTEDGRKVLGTSHWVSTDHAQDAEIRLYNHLFTQENPVDETGEGDYKKFLNPESVQVLTGCKVEPGLKEAKPGNKFQFLRTGYFSVDNDTKTDKLVFNRIVTLKDSWAKVEKRGK